MSLCTLCQSLDLLNIPKLPDSCNAYSAQNESPALISVIKRQPLQAYPENKEDATQPPDNESLGIPFHQNLSGLRVSAKACSICKIVAQDVADFQTAFNEAENQEHQRRMKEKGPDWTMYLAKGVNEISGFLVVSHDTENKSVVWVISAIGIIVDDDDALANVVAGRKISGDPGDEKTAARALGWIEECDETHGCKVDDAELPGRVLDVSSGVSVYMSHGEKGRYAVLSYVSETDSAHDEEMHKDGIDAESLPQTFQDAATMTRKLGLRFLWIDALCNDFSRSSPEYASIFANAYITLSATSSPSSTHGMLTPRSPPSYTSFPYTHASTTSTLYASPLNKVQSLYPSNDRILSPEPLSLDPWALQERLFSPRLLHLTSTSLHFECTAHFLSETGYKMAGRVDTLDQTFKSDVDIDATQKKSIVWKNVLELSCRRPLHHASHKLPALANIAARLASNGDTYIAGLWRLRLLPDLIWQATGFSRGRTRDSAIYRAPSWSWASIDGPFGTFTPGIGVDAGIWDDVAKILDVRVSLKDEDEPFGEVNDAWIKVSAPLEELVPVEDGPRKQVWKMRAKGGKGEGRVVVFDTLKRAERAKEGKLWAVVVMKSGRSGRADYHAVVVKAVEGKEETYTRVGKVMLDDETLGTCEWMGGGEEGKVDVVLV